MTTPFVPDYKTMGMIICQHINATKNVKQRREIATKLVMVLCEKMDEITLAINNTNKEDNTNEKEIHTC